MRSPPIRSATFQLPLSKPVAAGWVERRSDMRPHALKMNLVRTEGTQPILSEHRRRPGRDRQSLRLETYLKA